jgi:PilZ domain
MGVSDVERPVKRPAAYDRVEVLDRVTASRALAMVEAVESGDVLVLRLDGAIAGAPRDVQLHWFDGARAWTCTGRVEQLSTTRLRCWVPAESWYAFTDRRSPRVPADEAEMVVRIVTSRSFGGGRRFHARCLDVSEFGCRAAWSGSPPSRGDVVDLTWDSGTSRHGGELGWVAARVVRVNPLPSGFSEVAFSFSITKATQAARIRAWHQAWLKRKAA